MSRSAGPPDGPAPETAEEPQPSRRPRGASRRGGGGTLAFVESPVQLLNVLEWAFQDPAVELPERPGPEARRRHGDAPDVSGTAPGGTPDAPSGVRPDGAPDGSPEGEGAGSAEVSEAVENGRLTVVVLAPHDPMTRGQLRRVAELARDEGITVSWQEAREGATAPLKTIGSLIGPLRKARRIVIGDPFSRYVQLLLTLTSTPSVVVVDDGTATMEFVAQLARSERFVRWHRKGSGGPRAALFAPFSQRARSRLTPGQDRRVELFSSMPVEESAHDLGVTVTANAFAWTRSRFGPPRLTRGTDLVGTSLVETGVVDLERYLGAVSELARTHGATRYFAHRRENADKLHQVTAATGLEIVRPDLPLELVARRGPIGRTILSFPSTVVHTLPLALTGTPVTVAVCDIDPEWLTDGASPRAEGFLSGVTGTARGARRLGAPGAGSGTGAGSGSGTGPGARPGGAGPGSAAGAGPNTGPGTGGASIPAAS